MPSEPQIQKSFTKKLYKVVFLFKENFTTGRTEHIMKWASNVSANSVHKEYDNARLGSILKPPKRWSKRIKSSKLVWATQQGPVKGKEEEGKREEGIELLNYIMQARNLNLPTTL